MRSSDMATLRSWSLSAAEIHFLYWFIQGSIMYPETRWRLRHAWGFCERHACAFIAVEAAFREDFLHGPTILYQDLMEHALQAFPRHGLWPAQCLRWRLRERGPCLMCETGFSPASESRYAPAEIVARGQRLEALCAFAGRTRFFWERYVCGRCAGQAWPQRCRRHLLADPKAGDLVLQRALVADIAEHVTAYARSFRFEWRGTETDADRAGLVGALGWCSGWRTWLAIVGG